MERDTGPKTQERDSPKNCHPLPGPQGRCVPAPGFGLTGHNDVVSSWQPRWTKATSVLPGLVKSLLCSLIFQLSPRRLGRPGDSDFPLPPSVCFCLYLAPPFQMFLLPGLEPPVLLRPC